MTTYLGALHWFGVKPQAAAGVAEATPTTFLATTSLKMEPNMSPIKRKAMLGTGKNVPSLPGPIAPDGKAATEALASVPHPWYWALGAVTPTTVTSGVISHAITDGGAPVRLTLFGNRVHTGTRQKDGFVNKLRYSGKVGDIATLDIDWLALGHEDGFATSGIATSFPADVMTVMNATVKIDGAQSFEVNEFEIEWDGGLDAGGVIAETSGAPYFCRRKDIPTLTGKLKFKDFPVAEYEKLKAGTVFALETAVYGGTITGAHRKALKTETLHCQYTGGLDGDISDGVITGDANFQAFSVGTDALVTVTAINAIASIAT